MILDKCVLRLAATLTAGVGLVQDMQAIQEDLKKQKSEMLSIAPYP